MTNHQFSRRAFLRGLGVTMALPWMESLTVWGDTPPAGVKPGSEDAAASWDALSGEPTPAQAAMLTDLIDHLLQSLPPRDRQIISLGLEGKSLREISAAVNRAERTVRRVLDAFRHSLEASMLEDEGAAQV